MALNKEATGDIFTAPPSSLMHACKCRGSWGAGVAAALGFKYQNAYKIYHEHCLTRPSGVKTSGHVDRLRQGHLSSGDYPRED